MQSVRGSALWRALRPSQWVKNLLVAAAPMAAGRLLVPDVALRSAATFVVFSAAASATYLVNDCLDVTADRKHPQKRQRPIAAGELSERTAIATAIVLATLAIIGALALGQQLAVALGAYLLLTTGYSTLLKHIPVVDVIAVAAGFLIRSIAGGTAADVPISGWFALVVSAGALLLVVGKRCAELLHHGADPDRRRVLAWYTRPRLRAMAVTAVIVATGGYVGWANAVASHPDRINAAAWISVAPFTVAILRYGWKADRGAGESPDILLRSDRIVLGAGAVWALSYLIAVYG